MSAKLFNNTNATELSNENDQVNRPSNETTTCSVCLSNNSQNNSNSLGFNVSNLSELTPLLSNGSIDDRSGLNIWEKLWLGFFLIIILSAAGIGFYLLFSEDDTRLPPETFDLIPKKSWLWERRDSLQVTKKDLTLQYLTLPLSKVVVSHTNSSRCLGLYNCKKFLNELREKNGGEIPYNFLIDGAGRVYEGQGWFLQSHCGRTEGCDDSLYIAFIGRLDNRPPTFQQISAFRTFLDFSVMKNYLDRCFEIQVQLHNFSRKRYLIDMAYDIQHNNRKLNKCSVYL